MRTLIFVCILFSATSLRAQQRFLNASAADSSASLRGFTPLRLSVLPERESWPGASFSGRGLFGLHAYAVSGAGPTRDRANEAVALGWNPLGRLLPSQPGFWWQYEWSYGQDGLPLFELNLDLLDSISLSPRRAVSYKLNRNTGTGLSADFSFNTVTFVDGSSNAGDALDGAWLYIAPGADRFRANLRTEFRKLVQHTVHSHSSHDALLRLPLERGAMFSARLFDSTTVTADSTTILLNSMEAGCTYTVKLRNDRRRSTKLAWEANFARKLHWDMHEGTVHSIAPGETLIVIIVTDADRNAYASVHGRFRE
ncbi:MAG: hypothetical protein M5R41_17570 [Bacteroidia bacterium]|nr:hypothetical protein [Bacteroidia bacterium]